MYLDRLIGRVAITTNTINQNYALKTAIGDISQATRIIQGLAQSAPNVANNAQKALSLLNGALHSLQQRM